MTNNDISKDSLDLVPLKTNDNVEEVTREPDYSKMYPLQFTNDDEFEKESGIIYQLMSKYLG